MWRAIEAYHDQQTPSGYSPHQILFGEDRVAQGLMLATLGKACDCAEFMANAEEMAAKVTEALTKAHECAATTKRGRQCKVPYRRRCVAVAPLQTQCALQGHVLRPHRGPKTTRRGYIYPQSQGVPVTRSASHPDEVACS